MEKNNKKQKITLIIGIVLFLILVLSASYAYFQITSVNNATTTTITGNGEALGTPTLTTNTTSLGLTLTADLMSQDNAYKRLYATPSGTPIVETGNYTNGFTEDASVITVNNGRYKLATASVSTSDLSYNCTYNFDISATVTKTITDGSDHDIHVVVTSPKGETFTYPLNYLLAGTKTISGTINNLTKNESQEFTIESYVYNHNAEEQEGLIGNSYTITVTPKSGTNGFKCNVAPTPVITGFAKNLIDSNKMKQTGLEGDGYRFVGTGTGTYCSYDNGQFYKLKDDNACVNRYNYTRTATTGVVTNYSYATSCPASGSIYTISCSDPKVGTVVNNTTPANYVCFGTTSKSDCTNNPDKYMYRIIGVFPDEEGNQHVKLIKKTTIGSYKWQADPTKDIFWHDSELYKGINGSYFYTNTNYDYIQNSTWRNKITNWKWTETTDQLWTRGNIADINYLAPMQYVSGESRADKQKEVYLHEMNRKVKRWKDGYWTNVTARIGLMYASDYYLSVPVNNGIVSGLNEYITTSWLNPDSNYGCINLTGATWTISRNINKLNGGTKPLRAIAIFCDSPVYVEVSGTEWDSEVQPAFYLNSDVELSSGTGTEADPYILK